ncbi:MAG: outer membrane beta-barrel domain-containing protein [Bradymonadaceae bacterium]
MFETLNARERAVRARSSSRFERRSGAILAWIAGVALVLAAGPAAAQSGGGSGSSGATSSGSSASSGESGAKKGKKQTGPDPDDPHYWAKVRKVRTVQKREFQKVGRFAVTAYGGIIPNNIFERYFPVGVRLNYFILENIGVELSGSYAFKKDTGLRATLNEPKGVGAKGVRVGDSQRGHANFGITWSPFYGKMALYDDAIGYFDAYLFGGAGLVITKTPENLNQPKSKIPTTVKPEGVLGAGLAFYTLGHAAIRVDFRQFAFQKVKGVGGVANPSEISLGFGWFF